MSSNSNIVIFFDGTNICTSKGLKFVFGNYSCDYVNNYLSSNWIPILAKIESGTTLTVYFDSENSEPIVYNNSYNDRYVVIKLPNKIVKKFNVTSYIPNIEKLEFNQTGVFFSAIYIVILLALLFFFWSI
jgi:hypothetical protein